MKILSTLFIGTLALILHETSAEAQNARSFVSSTGLESNPCNRASPCRTFAGAIVKTNPGGEINTLDPAGYGPVTITKSISIVNGLGEAGVLVAPNGTGITISAGPDDKINLRGLIIEGAAAGSTGIKFNSGKSLIIENSVVRNMTGNGIEFNPIASSNLAISNTLVSDNDGDGIVVSPTGAGIVKTMFNRIEIYNNGRDGLVIDGGNSTGTVKATVADSVSANNHGGGFSSFSATDKAAPLVMLIRCVAANNNVNGIFIAGGTSTTRIGQTTLSGNTTGWAGFRTSGKLLSYGDNYIDENDNINAAPSTPPEAKK
ncbi:MAG: hypothetical protein QOG83_3482 [Alphaproteobacteria bacterium]|nr:hypothetical protein [Alphaproteobacteria bacterium]